MNRTRPHGTSGQKAKDFLPQAQGTPATPPGTTTKEMSADQCATLFYPFGTSEDKRAVDLLKRVGFTAHDLLYLIEYAVSPA